MSRLLANRGAPTGVIASALAGLVASGCSTTSAPTPKPPTVGIVTGVASPCWPYPTDKGIGKTLVRVNVSQKGKTVASQSVKGDHIYRFTLAPGHYVVSTPYSRLQAVIISTGHTVKVDLPDDCV